MKLIREAFSNLKFGYYHPPLERINGNDKIDFAE
jgi:hypothetical protein